MVLAGDDAGAASATNAEGAVLRRRLVRCLDRLPSERRETVVLRLIEGMTLEEIADVTRVGRETVKSRLRYALAKLRQELNGSGMSHEADVA